MPVDDAGQPPALIGHGVVAAARQLGFELCQLGRQPLRVGDPPDPEPPAPVGRADVREPQERERFRFPVAPGFSPRGGVPPEFDQPGFVRVQLQAELREPLAQRPLEPLSVVLVLEPCDKIISEPHDDHVTARVMLPPPLGPQVQDVVQVHVGEQRRNRCSLWRPLLRFRQLPVFDDPCGQPLADQPQDPFIRDPVPEEPLKPASVKLPEEVADIRVQHPAHLVLVDPGRQRVQRVMRLSARPEPVRDPPEIRLEYGVQHFRQRSLDDLVLQRRHPERAHPPVRLRNQHPPHRLGPVRSRLHPSVQVPQVTLQVPPVLLPPHTVRARCRVLFQRRERRPQPVE